MTTQAKVLAALAEAWPKPTAAREQRFGAAPGSEEHRRKYAREQYMRKLWHGFGLDHAMPDLWGKTVVEVGCGHGGISVFLGGLGAARVVGLDLNHENLQTARSFRDEVAAAQGKPLPVDFLIGDAMSMPFAAGTIDVAIADNLFEHVTDPAGFLRELHRVLRPDGLVVVPIFSSIWSKHGLHLKHALGVPWANLVFSEATIVEAVQLRAQRHPELLATYPGAAGTPARVRDLRKHRDLNDLTYGTFRSMAATAGFDLVHFRVQATLPGKVVRRASGRLERTPVLDVLSTGASAVLRPTRRDS